MFIYYEEPSKFYSVGYMYTLQTCNVEWKQVRSPSQVETHLFEKRI